jgi:hypothetical protein|tara:strand:+ start:99 stop:455 length:357 start_codon:yes stop_codon:yes gene_type:complete
MTVKSKRAKSKGPTVAAQLKKAKNDLIRREARIAKQMADFKKWSANQKSAINELIRSGKVSADVNKVDNNNNKTQQGPNKPKPKPRAKVVGGGRAAAVSSMRGGLSKSIEGKKLLPKT